MNKEMKLVSDSMTFSFHRGLPVVRHAIATKAPLRVQFLLTFLGGGGGRARSFGFTQ